jgi:serine/threonine protein kinase
MAPEILLGKSYSGQAIDLFACGIILFVMVTAGPPFFKALSTDPLYKLIVDNRDDFFLATHQK